MNASTLEGNGTPPQPTSSSDVPLAAAHVEITKLRERLAVSDEWNLRLQAQIQELLRLPQNEAEAMRERMQNPDIAIPLLQCYDAAIQERTMTIETLEKENAQLRSRVEATSNDHDDLTHAVRVAEDLATHIKSTSAKETEKLQQLVQSLQQDAGQLRQEVTRALEAESTAKLELEKSRKEVAEWRAHADEERRGRLQMEDALKLATNRLKVRTNEASEVQLTGEANQVEMSLLRKQNSDKVEELEQLRSKMIQALRQASENHAAHLRVVEERQKIAVEDLRSMNRTQELEIQKLRAQLARVDPMNPSGSSQRYGFASFMGAGAGGGGGGFRTTTTELIEAQTRQALETEVKRVYAELSSVQVQRDDAILRYEQMTSSTKREQDHATQDVQRDVQRLQRKSEELALRKEQLEAEVGALKAQATPLKDRLKSAVAEAHESRLERDSAQRQAAELKRQLQSVQEQLDAAHRENTQLQQGDRQRAEEADRRVQDVLADLQVSKDRAYTEVATTAKQRDQLREALEAARRQCHESAVAVEGKERDRRLLETQLARMEEALSMHKRQLSGCDMRIRQLTQQLDESAQTQRQQALALEQAKMEVIRLGRSRDRLMDTVHTRVYS